ncbi:porin family protein [uncultured Bacteroides sp.]|uniref:porin family protein n=1 Tax=uncultured Bacteroides sp. TaxID=162156 RepID=UPI0026340313|nr:porin family protein [uncultured Bacteroides sp.]
MKKILSVFVLAVCCLAMAMPAQAQLIKFGVKGGLNMSKLDVKNVGTSDNTTGFFIGPMAEITIPVLGLGVDGALMYSQRGEDDWKQQGIEIPVNLKYTIGLGSLLGVYVAAGPDFFFNFKDIDWENVKTNKTQVGLNLGVGVKLIKHLQVGVNYQIPLGDSFSLKNATDAIVDEIGGNGKTKTWQISAAYIF